MSSNEYWRKREEEALRRRITDEKEYDKRIKKIYADMIDACQKEINAFYGKYAGAEGISINEAKKRITQLDMEAYERKAARYVEEKNFSKTANEEMRLYNATMKINRLEMLKANIGLELISGHDELEKFMAEILQGRTEDELERQAGILGDTIRDNAKRTHSIVNASFHNATFSDRIWTYQDLLKADLSKLLQTGLIRGENPRVLGRELERKFGASRYNAERLMRTELARVQTEAQKASFEKYGFEEYTFHANSGCCDLCSDLNGRHFKVKDMMPGENASPIHPGCRCSCSAYEDSEEYEAWLDFISKGGTTGTWSRLNTNLDKLSKNGIIIPRDKLTKYAFDQSKAPDKAEAFKKALGYDMTNCDELIENIAPLIKKDKFIRKGDNGYGMLYEYIVTLIGTNGKQANVLTAWIQDEDKKRLTSIYITGRRSQNEN